MPALQLLVRPVRASTSNLEPDLNCDNITRFQREDNNLREVLKWAEQQLVMEHGILYIRWEPTRPTDHARLRVLTPRGLRSTVMKHFHDQKTAGHLGVAKTFSKLATFTGNQCARRHADGCRTARSARDASPQMCSLLGIATLPTWITTCGRKYGLSYTRRRHKRQPIKEESTDVNCVIVSTNGQTILHEMNN